MHKIRQLFSIFNIRVWVGPILAQNKIRLFTLHLLSPAVCSMPFETEDLKRFVSISQYNPISVFKNGIPKKIF